MAHNCKALLIHCMDFRIIKSMREYLSKNNLLGDCDVISVAGGIKSLLSPKNPTDRDFILGQIEVSLNLHKIQKVIISNHTDCGAYKDAGPFDSFKEECAFHIEEMSKAKNLILSKFTGLKVEMVLGKIISGGLELEQINK